MDARGVITRALKRIIGVTDDRTDTVVKAEYRKLWGGDTRKWSQGPVRDEIWSVLIDEIRRLNPATVLEVGSGNGINIAVLAERFPHVSFTGVELTKEGVLSSPKIRNATFVQGDARRLPFPDRAFDFAFTSVTIEQIPRDYLAAFREIRRVSNRALFIEAFREHQNLLQYLYLFGRDYFRSSYRVVERAGWRVVSVMPFKNWKPEYRLSALRVC